VQPDDEPIRNDEPWLYCGKCGSPMAWRDAGHGFSRVTGRAVDLWAWSCPEWDHAGDGRKHDRGDRVCPG
jgi:hypothetical protein